MPRVFRLSAALFAVALLGVPAAHAQDSNPGLFSVSPARQVANGTPPKKLPSFTVSNSTDVALQVKVFPGLLDQRVDGQMFFSERAADLRGAATLVRISPASFELAAGDQRTVTATWVGLPGSDKVLNAGIVFQSVAKATGAVQTVQRLLTLNFLQLPGRYRTTGEFSLLRAQQGAEPKTLEILPRIKNTGEITQSPQNGKVTVRNSAGDVVFRGVFNGDVILPSHERDFPVIVRKILPEGDYAMSATADFGTSKNIKIVSKFRLVGPNQLPTPRIALENFAGHGEIGGDSEATGVVHSVGSETASTNVKVQLFRLNKDGQRPVEPMKEQKVAFEDLAPGAKRDLRIVYPGLPAGNYRLIATYRDTPDTVAHVEVDFSPALPKKDKGSSALGPVLGAVGAITLGGLFFLFWKRRRREDEDDEPAPHAAPAAVAAAPPATAPPAAPGAVDLNTAGVDELQTLPGVGPRAAARIVEHREEYGAFTSIDELQRVEGFDEARIAALRDRVTL